jgi:Protein NO VEIN, C-terminal
MRNQGVGWTPTQPSQEEDNIDQMLAEQLSGRLIQSVPSADTTPTTSGQDVGESQSELTDATVAEQDNDAQPSAPLPRPTQTAVPSAPPSPGPAPLPPIETVRPRVVLASANWSPNTMSDGSQRGASVRSGTGGDGAPASERRTGEVGQRGEELVYRHEQNRVRQLGLPVECVQWVSRDNPNANYDILSVDDDGSDLWIEVKATTGRDGRFEWSRAEFELARRKHQHYLIWRVYEADTETPTLRKFRDPIALFSSASLDLDVGTLITKGKPPALPGDS